MSKHTFFSLKVILAKIACIGTHLHVCLDIVPEFLVSSDAIDEAQLANTLP